MELKKSKDLIRDKTEALIKDYCDGRIVGSIKNDCGGVGGS